MYALFQAIQAAAVLSDLLLIEGVSLFHAAKIGQLGDSWRNSADLFSQEVTYLCGRSREDGLGLEKSEKQRIFSPLLSASSRWNLKNGKLKMRI